MKLTSPLIVYLPDTRGVEISPFGKGNTKIGQDVYTYSRLAEYTCPGATEECLEICYAKRIVGPVRDQYALNSQTADVPPLPRDCRLLRIHISGDFDSPDCGHSPTCICSRLWMCRVKSSRPLAGELHG